MKSSYQYRERDYTFGNYCVTLRTALGVTQGDLARMLGVSERAIQTWEGGLSYPKMEHFKHFIELCVQQHVFSAEKAQDEVRTLWKLARLKGLFDEQWLQQLLIEQSGTSDTTSETSSMNARRSMDSSSATLMTLPVSIAMTATRVDWGEAFDVSYFYGREHERAELTCWIVEERCRVVGVLGMGGIGKTALTIKLMHEVVQDFQVVVWRSVRDAPFCEDLLDDILQVLSPQLLNALPEGFAARISLLIELMRAQRCLIVLDNLETLLREQEQEGRFREGYEDYGQLIQRVGEMAHKSCLVLTSREKPIELIALDGSATPVRSLQLTGLDEDAGESILREKGLQGDSEAKAKLIASYSGNPLALKIVSESIRELFEGDIAAFLAENVLLFRGIRTLLAQQFARLTPLEQQVMFWLSIMREPVEFSELLSVQATPIRRLELLESLETLRYRSLIERRQTRFVQQSVVLEYVTDVFVQRMSEEIQRGEMKLLCSHALKLATAKEYIRLRQERILIVPVLAELRTVYASDGVIAAHLSSLLDRVRHLPTSEQAYGPTNIASLLYHLQGHLRNVDLSHIALREAYLQGVEMQYTSLRNALLQNTVFTHSFAMVVKVITSKVGNYWAACFTTGEVRVWQMGSNTLYAIMQAHSNASALAFTSDGRTLASGGRDTLIKLWDVESKTLLRVLTGHTSYVNSLDFSPDGQILASSDAEGIIHIWDVSTGASLKTIAVSHEAVFDIHWHPDGRLLAGACSDHAVHIWDTQSGERVQTFSGHKQYVITVKFSPDGMWLVSGSYDHTVKLWDVNSGVAVKTFSGHTNSVGTVDFSPDGKIVASGSFDANIYLWKLNSNEAHMILSGHKDAIHSVAFARNGVTILSGGKDGTIREWDMASGDNIHVIAGYSNLFYDVSFSPDGRSLASNGLDAILTLWNAATGKPEAHLHGHRQSIISVAWSPDGQQLASGSNDQTIRIWNTETGACTHILRGHTGMVTSVVWHPSGKLLASAGSNETVRIWDMTYLTCRWIFNNIRASDKESIAWSPDGQYIAYIDADDSIRLLQVEDGTVYQTLGGHYAAHTEVEVLAWSPNGTRLLSGGGTVKEGKLLLWDVQSGQCLQVFTGNIQYVTSIAWYADGKHVVSADISRKLCLWDVTQGKILAQYQALSISSLSISPDEKTIAICGRDIITLLDTSTLTPQRTLHLERPYEQLDITSVQGLTEAQRTSLLALGAIDSNNT